MEPFRRFEMHNGRRKAKPVNHAPEHLDIFPQLQQVIDDEPINKAEIGTFRDEQVPADALHKLVINA